MKRIRAVSVVAATLLFAPLEVAAKSGGSGFGLQRQSVKSASSNRPVAHRQGFRRAPWGWGYFAQNNYFALGYDGDVPHQAFVVSPKPPRFLNCLRNREIVDVPSEGGGTREIMVARC